MKKTWKRAISSLLAFCMTASLSTGLVAAEDPGNTTKFPEWYTQYEEVPGSGELIGTDYIALGLKMTDEEINTKIDALLNTMTDAEKFTYLGGGGTGTVYGNAGDLPGTARLGVPEMRMHDGPAGVLSLWPTTNTPDRQAAAATWDPELIEQYGVVYGSEGKAIGENMQLGAQYDITRTPEFGRANDQYAEDPYLLAQMAAAETRGIQSQGIIAVGKHYAAFAQDASPAGKTDIIVSEQALHELYLPAFEAAVKDGGMMGLMSSYNSVNGTFASANTYLQLDVLRDLWGYQGFTITDWGGNDGFTLTKGTDIEMPSLSNNKLANAIVKIPDEAERNAVVNNAVRHVLNALGQTGYLYLVETYVDADGVLKAKEEPGRTARIKLYADSATNVLAIQEQSNAIVQAVAESAGVLLENKNNTLPVAADETVAMIGTGAKYTLSGTGGERSYGVGYRMDSPYESMKAILGDENVALEAVFDNGGEIIPAENLFTLDAEGNFIQGFTMTQGETSTTVTGSALAYLPAEKSFAGGSSIANVGGKNNTADNTYTWITYIKAPTTGEYTIMMQGIGGNISATVAKADSTVENPATGKSSVSYASSQGAQWHSGDYCTETGASIGSSVVVSMEEGKYYQVVVTGVANRTEKNMQLALDWKTPAHSAKYDAATKTLSGGAIENAIELAKTHDKVVIFGDAKAQGKPATRNPDNLNLSAEQEAMILAVAAAAHEAGNKVIVVLNNETAITIQNWVDQADAILMMYRPGQRGGAATANLLTGIVNPSGKLAYAMPMEGNQTLITYTEESWNKQVQPAAGANNTIESVKALNDGELDRIWGMVASDLQMRYGMSFNSLEEFRAALDDDTVITVQSFFGSTTGPRNQMIVDGINSKMRSATNSYYDEGILTGYRFYDSVGLEPRYDFGYGLSYTTFAYSDLSVVNAPAEGETVGYDVTFTVTNTGSVAGREVAELYLGQASNLPEGIQSAPVQLAGFQKTELLQPGESTEITLHVTQRSLSFWNQNLTDTLDKWTVANGLRTIYVGAASDNLALSEEVNVMDHELAITAGPETFAGKVGETASFTVEANRDDVTYQWFYSNNGWSWSKSSMEGAATDTLSVEMKAFRVGQQYKCVVTDSEGNTVTSEVVALTVASSEAKIVENPSDVTVAVKETAVFTVKAEGEGMTYQWMYSNNGGASWSKSTAPGATTANLSIEAKEFRNGQMYKCIVCDAQGNAVESTAAAIVIEK